MLLCSGDCHGDGDGDGDSDHDGVDDGRYQYGAVCELSGDDH